MKAGSYTAGGLKNPRGHQGLRKLPTTQLRSQYDHGISAFGIYDVYFRGDLEGRAGEPGIDALVQGEKLTCFPSIKSSPELGV